MYYNISFPPIPVLQHGRRPDLNSQSEKFRHSLAEFLVNGIHQSSLGDDSDAFWPLAAGLMYGNPAQQIVIM